MKAMIIIGFIHLLLWGWILVIAIAAAINKKRE